MNELKSPLRVLHLEDNDHDAELVRRRLAKEGITLEFTQVTKRETYVEALEKEHFDLIMCDFSLPGFNGGAALDLAHERHPRTPFIFVSGTLAPNVAIESLKRGAANCVSKDSLDRLAPAILAALQEREAGERRLEAQEALSERAELFEQISETVTDLVVVLDLDGRRLYSSPSYQTLFKTDSLQGTDAFADIHPEDRLRIRQLFDETVQTGAGKPAEFRLLLKDGAVRYLESQGGVIRDKAGAVSSVIVVSRDMTKRKRAEEKLKASEDRFRCLFQTANDAIILTDVSGNIGAWNSAAQRMFGYSEEEVRSKPLTSLLPERYRERQQAGFGLTTASRFIAIAVELHGLRKDGSEFPLELSLSTWRSDGERAYSATLRDITERDQTRQTLEQLRRQNELLLNSAGEGICGLNREGKITFINPAAAKMLGYSVGEVVGCSWQEVVCRTQAQQAPPWPTASSLRATLDYGTVHRVADQQFWRKNGTHFSAEYVCTPVRDKNVCTGAVVVFKDNTEHQQVAAQLREQAALIEDATDAICVINMDARIIYWNKSAASLYGWSAHEAIGRIAHDLLFKRETHRPDQAFRTLIDNREWKGELLQVTKAGREIVVQSRWTLMHDNQGTPKSILVINTDITEKKDLEAQFLRAQRLESIGRLAGGIAHDLNNVLSPILMIAPLLESKLADPEDRKMLEMAATSARRGADLVGQILSFSRGAEEKQSLVQIRTLINEQVKVARQTFPPSIDVRSKVAQDLRLVLGNATQLFQVVMNLCVNARDAMPNGGILSLEAENVLLDNEYVRLHPEAKTGPHVVLTISDTGTGIPPEILDKIFKSFFTTKKPGRGTGLGLSTVLTIVTNHHGHMRVKSEVGKGAKFDIYLPASEAGAAQGKNEHVADSPKGHGEWVLVVDDEETIREITTATLEHAGYCALTASDGTEAVARYARYKDRISIVIADMVMPFMDGGAMIQALKRMNPAVKILAMSGRIEDKALDHLIEKKEIVFLSKPFSSEKLLTSVHQILAGEGAMRRSRG
jgi:PAS domain S-box-containing protein